MGVVLGQLLATRRVRAEGIPPSRARKFWREPSRCRRCAMKKFIAALALISLIAIPSLTVTANAAPVSPSSPAFGSNGY